MKNRIKSLEKKIMCISLGLLICITVINPNIITFAYEDFQGIESEFHEKVSTDQISSDVQLMIKIKENQNIESLVLPDGSRVKKERFQKKDDQTLIFHYEATENKKLNYVVEYTETKMEETGEVKTSELKTSDLSYEVKNLRTLKDILSEDKDITVDIQQPEIIGYHNATFKQEVSIASNSSHATKEWTLYIPVPKKGQSLQYTNIVNGKSKVIKSAPSEFSLKLSKKLDITNYPAGTKITYTTDKNPLYTFDGSSLGNYSDIGDDQLSDVTMIKIEVPSLSIGQKISTSVDFQVAEKKSEVGIQVASGTVYFNMKSVTGNDYIYSAQGSMTSPITFKLKDYKISGFIWEDVHGSGNIGDNKDTGIYNKGVDILKANVTVQARMLYDIDPIYTAITDENGKYTLYIPMDGGVSLDIVMPNNPDAYPKENYIKVRSFKGDQEVSSWFGKDGTIMNLYDKDIENINGGIYAIGSFAMNTDKKAWFYDYDGQLVLYVRQGTTVQITDYLSMFPKYDKLQFVPQRSIRGNIYMDEDGFVTADGAGDKSYEFFFLYHEKPFTISVRMFDMEFKPLFDSITIYQGVEYDFKNEKFEFNYYDGPKTDFFNSKYIVGLGDKHYYTGTINGQPVFTIDSSAVDNTKPGKYPVIYKFPHQDGTVETHTYDVYVHGKIDLKLPKDKIVKINEKVNTLEGASASYVHVNDDGTTEVRTVPVTTSQTEITSSTASKKEVVLNAEVTINGVKYETSGTYNISFNETAKLAVQREHVTVNPKTSLNDIKDMIKATAKIETADGQKDLTDQINWDFLKDFDVNKAGNSIIGKIYVIDPDNGKKIEKEITVSILKDFTVDFPKVDKVVGDTFDPTENVIIKDGHENIVDFKTVDIDDSRVDMSKPGNYDVTYTYTNVYGEKTEVLNIIHVHGALQTDEVKRIDLKRENDKTYIPDAKKVYYINSDGEKVYIEGKYDQEIHQSDIGLSKLTLKVLHPINQKELLVLQNVYVHGEINFHKNEIQNYKVGDTIDLSQYITASYKKVNDDGSLTEVYVPLNNTTIKAEKIGYKDIQLEATTKVNDLKLSGKENIRIGFDGYPYIDSVGHIVFNEGEQTLDEVKAMIAASAGVVIADGSVEDLTQEITYKDIDKVNVSQKGTYPIVLSVSDNQGHTATKTVVIQVNEKVSIIQTVPEQSLVPERTENVTEDIEEKDSYVIISKDIPLSELEKGITDELVKSYITAKSKLKGVVDFEIVSNQVKAESGTYEIIVRLPDGTEQTVKINVVDDTNKNVQKPEYGQSDDCFIQWILLLILLGYNIYAIAMIRKRHYEIEGIEQGLHETVVKRKGAIK